MVFIHSNFFDIFMRLSASAWTWKSIGQTTVIAPNLLVQKFCENVFFLQSFGQFFRNSAKTVRFRKISTPGNSVKFQYFTKPVGVWIYPTIWLLLFLFANTMQKRISGGMNMEKMNPSWKMVLTHSCTVRKFQNLGNSSVTER